MKITVSDGPTTLRGKTFRRCHECDQMRVVDNLIEVEVFDSPWEDGRTIYLCRDDVYTPSDYSEDCLEQLTDTGWADFRYFTCDGCERLVISQNPRNGYMSYVRIVNECDQWCLRCYEEELMENGLNEIGRAKLEIGQLPGMFFSSGNHQLIDNGWEQVGEDRYINSQDGAGETAVELIRLMDDGFKVMIGYESMGIGGGEGYISLWRKSTEEE